MEKIGLLPVTAAGFLARDAHGAADGRPAAQVILRGDVVVQRDSVAPLGGFVPG